MSCVHFIGGEKGGVGKSLFSQLVCQWFIEHEVAISALDADASRGALLRSYAEVSRAIDLSVFESADQIMDRALAKERQVVVDLPAQSFRQLDRWLEESDVATLASEMAVDLVYYHVTDGGFDSMKTLETAMSRLPELMRIVVVCNHRFSNDFSHIESSSPLQAVTSNGGTIIALPMLDPRLLFKVESRGASLRSVFDLSRNGTGILTVMERRRVERWRALTDAQLEPVLTASPAVAETLWSKGDFPRARRDEHQRDRAPDVLSVPDVPLPQAAQEPTRPKLPVGTRWNDGAKTWTEVGENCLIHHVKYP